MKASSLFVLLLLLALTAMRWWCTSYRCVNGQLAELVETKTIEQIKAREDVPPDTNGWFELSRILKLPPPSGGPPSLPPALKQADLERLLRPMESSAKVYQQSSFQRALKAYENLLNSLSPAIKKPSYWKPSKWKLGYKKSGGSAVGLVYEFTNAQIYSEHLSLQGDNSQALTVLYQHLELADKMGQQGTIEDSCDYSQCLASCLHGLQSILPKLSLRQLDDCQVRLSRLSSPIEDFLNRRNESYLEQLQALRLVALGQSHSVSLPTNQRILAQGLGLFKREETAVRNLYLLQRTRMERGLLAEDFGRTPTSEVQAVQQQAHGYYLEEVCEEAKFSYPQALCLRTDAKLQALRISCAIQRFKNCHGYLPTSLEDLIPKFLTTLPHNPVTIDGRFSYEIRNLETGYTLKSRYRSAVIQALLPDDLEVEVYCYFPVFK